MCQVSGGFTGFRQSPLKQDGEVRYFNSRDEAQAVADKFNKQMNTPYSTADFRYWPEEAN